MMLRNPREEYRGQAPENVFLAVDERSGEKMGACVITEEDNPSMYPQRPHQVRLDIEGSRDTLDSLMGAALARARALCAQSGKPSRIYAVCGAEDETLLGDLREYGFRDNDGIVRMRAVLPVRSTFKAPTGCVVVRDRLEDAQEQRFFLERYNELFNTDHDLKWLTDFMQRENFLRTLTVAPTGMAGEIVTWNDAGEGVVGFIQTARRWRHMGVAKYMISLGCESISALGITGIRADIRARMPYMLKTMEKAGFYQDSLVIRYPGIDL